MEILTFNEPIYHGVQACLYQCHNKKGNPYVQLQHIRTCYKSLFGEKSTPLSLSLSLYMNVHMHEKCERIFHKS